MLSTRPDSIIYAHSGAQGLAAETDQYPQAHEHDERAVRFHLFSRLGRWIIARFGGAPCLVVIRVQNCGVYSR